MTAHCGRLSPFVVFMKLGDGVVGSMACILSKRGDLCISLCAHDLSSCLCPHRSAAGHLSKCAFFW